MTWHVVTCGIINTAAVYRGAAIENGAYVKSASSAARNSMRSVARSMRRQHRKHGGVNRGNSGKAKKAENKYQAQQRNRSSPYRA